MIISDLSVLEDVSEVSSIVGGRGRGGGNRQTARGNRGNNANASNTAKIISINFVGGSLNGGSQSIDVDVSQVIDLDQILEGANNNLLRLNS